MRKTKPRAQYLPKEWEEEGYSVGELEYLDDDHAVQGFYKDGVLFGLDESHWDKKERRWCGGYVSLRDEKAWKKSGHTVIEENPWHVEASLGCNTCESHGFIRDGKWVEA